MAKNTTETPTPGTGDNGQVDAAKDATKTLVAKMKAIGLDSKGLYTEWNNGAVDAEGNNGAVDMVDFMVSKKKLTTDDKSAILTMFDAMAKANAPKVKVAKPVPDELAENLAQTWYTQQQVLAQYNAAKLAVETLWAKPRDVAKLELDEACAAVIAAGLFVDRKTGKIKTTKTGSTTTDGTHGNSGTTKLSIGWIDIKISGVEYDSWKSAVQALEPDMIVATSTNYLANTQFANKCAAKGLAIAVTIKLAMKDHTTEQALEAWNALADDGKFASGAHRKLAEVGASITIA